MTTITIEQSLLEQALNALLLPCDRWNKQQFLIVKGAIESLNAALAAPAAAPEPICTKCGDVITAHDPGLCGCCLSTRDTTTPVQPSWQDAPTKPGMWACLYMGELSTAIFNAYEIEHFYASEMGGCRWQFIPDEDKP